jgi:dTDP-glucose pyrophosphorylase
LDEKGEALKFWADICVGPESDIREVISRIDNGSAQLALVVDGQRRLLGTVTDGDVRRGILRGVTLDESVSTIMNGNPTTAGPNSDRTTILALMKQKLLRQIPIIDREGCLLGLETLDELLSPTPRENIVVLMAGGEGTRLRPLTDDCPKPMLRVGERPILETILSSFIEYGFRHFYFSVNYRAEVIVDHFGDGDRWGVRIDYLRETERMGTAGALSLLPQRASAPLVVMNGDLLTKVNLDHLLDFHVTQGAKATMCVRKFDFQVPYGVLKLDHYRIAEIEEKPVQRFFVNAGIYVLEPEVLDLLPQNQGFDMPALFDRLIADGLSTVAFPLREYWLDIGRHADFDKAQGDYARQFES